MKTTTTSRAANVPPIIQDKIQRYQKRFKRLALAEGVAETLAVFLALFTVNLLLDWFVPMSFAARATLVVATWLVSAAVFVGFIMFKVRKTFSDAAVAMALERSAPSLDEKLVSTVELIETPDPDEFKGSPALIHALTRQTTDEVAPMEFQKALSPKRALRFAGIAAGLACALMLGALIAGEHFSLLFKRFVLFWDDSLPRAAVVTLASTTGDVACEWGKDVTIEAAVTRGSAPNAALHFIAEDGRRVVVAMERKNERTFTATLRGVTSNGRYYVESRRVQSVAHRITALRGPQIESLKISYAFPSFTKLEPRVEVTRDGDITAPVGTNVTIEATFDRDITEAAVHFAGALPQPLEKSAPRTALARFTVMKDTTFHFRASDERGFATPDGVVFRVKTQPNAAPSVALTEPVTDLQLSRPAPIRVAYTARDDFGVKALRLVWEIAGSPERHAAALPLPATATENVSGVHEWDLAAANIASGARVTFWIEAEDETADGKPNKTASTKRQLQLTADAEFSIRAPEFIGAKRILEKLGEAAVNTAHVATDSAKLLAEFNTGKVWNTKLTTLRESLRAAEPSVLEAFGEWRDAMQAQARLLVAAGSDKGARADLELVDAVMKLAVLARADAAKETATLPSPFSNDDTARLAQTVAERSAFAHDTTTLVRDQFARLADSREMRVMAHAAKRLVAATEQAQRFAQARAEGRSTDAELNRAHGEIKFLADALADNFAALTAVLPDNAAMLKSASDILKSRVLASLDASAALLEKSKHGEVATELAAALEDAREFELLIAATAKQSASAADKARAMLRELLQQPLAPQLDALPKIVEPQFNLALLTSQLPPEQIEKITPHIEERKKDFEEQVERLQRNIDEATRDALHAPKPDTQFAKDLQELRKALGDLKDRNNAPLPNLADAGERKKFLDEKRDIKKQIDDVAKDFAKIEAAHRGQQLAGDFSRLAQDQAKLGKATENAKPDDKRLGDLGDGQDQLTPRMENAEDKLGKTAQDVEKDNPELAKALAHAHDQLRALKPSDLSKDAARALNDGKPQDAVAAQREAQGALENAANNLQRAAAQAATDADQARQNFAARNNDTPLDAQMNALAGKQGDLAKKTDDAAKQAPQSDRDDNAKRADDLRAEQDDLVKKAEALARALSLQAMNGTRNGGDFNAQRDLLNAAAAAHRAAGEMKTAQARLAQAAANPDPTAQQNALEQAQAAQDKAARELAQTAQDLATTKNADAAPQQIQEARDRLRLNDEALPREVREHVERADALEDLRRKQEDLQKQLQDLRDAGRDHAPQEIARAQQDLVKQLQDLMRQQRDEQDPLNPRNQDKRNDPPQQGGQKPKQPQQARDSQPQQPQQGDQPKPNAQAESQPGKAGQPQPDAAPEEQAIQRMNDAAINLQQGDTGKPTAQAMNEAGKLLAEARNQILQQAAKPSAMPSLLPLMEPSAQATGNTTVTMGDSVERRVDLGQGQRWETLLQDRGSLELLNTESEKVSPEWERMVKLYFDLLSSMSDRSKK